MGTFEKLIDPKKYVPAKIIACIVTLTLVFGFVQFSAFAGNEEKAGSDVVSVESVESSADETENAPSAPDTDTSKANGTTSSESNSAQKAPAVDNSQSVVDVALSMTNAYITVKASGNVEQTVPTQATKVSATTTKDLQFVAYANEGYELSKVEATNADGAKVTLTEKGNDTYVVSKSDIKAGLKITVVAEKASQNNENTNNDQQNNSAEGNTDNQANASDNSDQNANVEDSENVSKSNENQGILDGLTSMFAGLLGFGTYKAPGGNWGGDWGQPSSGTPVYVYMHVVDENGNELTVAQLKERGYDVTLNSHNWFTVGELPSVNIPNADKTTSVTAAMEQTAVNSLNTIKRYSENLSLNPLSSNIDWSLLRIEYGADNYVVKNGNSYYYTANSSNGYGYKGSGNCYHLDGTLKVSSLTNYTVKYVDTDGKPIKEDATYSAIIGSDVKAEVVDIPGYTFVESSPESIIADENAEKNVITLKYAIAPDAPSSFTTATDKPYIKVTKTFSGVDVQDVEALYDTYKLNVGSIELTLSQATKSTDGLTFTWLINDANTGTYNVKETGYDLDGYIEKEQYAGSSDNKTPLTDSGVSIQTAAASMTATVTLPVKNNNSTVKEVGTISQENGFIVASFTDNTYAVWTAEHLSAAQRVAFINAYKANASGGLKNITIEKTSFYSGSSLSDTISTSHGTVQYKDGKLYFSNKDVWRMFDIGTYSNTAAQNAEIAITNVYEKEISDLNAVKALTNTGSGNEGAFKAGDTATFTITVTNAGTVTETNIEVAEQAGVTIAEGTGYTVTDGKAYITSLAPGANVVVNASMPITQEMVDAGNVKNVATVNGEETNEVPVDVDQTAALTVEKTVTNTPANGTNYLPGETIAYQIVVTNTGNLTITNTQVVDPLTGDTWTIDTLAPAESRTFEATHVVTEEEGAAGSVTNVATATGTTPDPNNPETTNEDEVISTTEPTPVVPPAETPEPTTPAAEPTVLDQVVTALAGENIDEEGNPLTGFDHIGCWVHWYIIVGIILTAIYGVGVVARRKNYTNKLADIDNNITNGAAPGGTPQNVNDGATVSPVNN